MPRITRLLSGSGGESCTSRSTSPVVAVTDYLTLVPDMVTRWVPRPFSVLGTDGFGRSDTREALRRFFEVDAAHVTLAVLTALARQGTIPVETVTKAIRDLGIDPELAPPFTR